MKRSALTARSHLSVLVLALVLVACGRQRASLPDFADLVARVSPSVVNISAIGDDTDPQPAQQAPSTAPGDDTPDWLRKYLQHHDHSKGGSSGGGSSGDDGGADDGEPYGGNQARSLGSGFILSSDGYILTNEHVIDKARQVIVRLSDGRQMTAKVVGDDRRSDLALLKINADNLPAVKIADISKQRVGEWVLAIGSPFGFDHSVTVGIISAKGRSLDTEQYVPFIQTDAAINPGNSGGPLFNLQGQVVGVNSQIYSQTGGFIGLAFAIPIDVAIKVAHQLKATGHVRRGWLGVMVQEVTRELAASFKLTVPRGALVARVLPDSPAAQSGLRTGDVILSFNGITLRSSRDLPPLVGNADPDQTVDLKLLRDGKVVTLKVQLGVLSSDSAKADSTETPDLSAPPATGILPARPDLELQMRALTSDEKSAGKLNSGVVITAVGSGPARDAGLQPGDVLLTLAGQKVDSPQRFSELLSRLTPGRTVPVLVQRQSGPLFLALTVPARR